MAAMLIGDRITIGNQQYVSKEEYDTMKNWISDIARAVNQLSMRIDMLEQKEPKTTDITL